MATNSPNSSNSGSVEQSVPSVPMAPPSSVSSEPSHSPEMPLPSQAASADANPKRRSGGRGCLILLGAFVGAMLLATLIYGLQYNNDPVFRAAVQTRIASTEVAETAVRAAKEATGTAVRQVEE